MDELTKQIAERTGISQEQARQAVELTLGFVKEKLPAPVAAQVDSLLGGQGDAAGQALGMLGGLFGKQ
jgi:hypothetical protein